jgi:hypothetical protein
MVSSVDSFITKNHFSGTHAADMACLEPAGPASIRAHQLAMHATTIAVRAVSCVKQLTAIMHADVPAGGGSSRYTPSTASADAAELSSGSEDEGDENDVYAHASDPGDNLPHKQQQHRRRRQLHWDAAGSAAAAGAGAAADSDDEDDLCQWQGGLKSPLQQQQQQQLEQGLGALRDISNSNRMAHGHRHSQQQLKQKQQHDTAGTSRAAEDAACNAVHVEEDGHLLVEAQVLQLLLDKVGRQFLPETLPTGQTQQSSVA